MDYGQLLSQGWKITWENKYLWILGFLAALTSSRANSSSFNYSSGFDPTAYTPEQLSAFGGAMVALSCFALFVGLLLWVVSLVAKGGLITAVYKTSVGKEMNLEQALSAGSERIWPILGMNLLLYLPFILIGIGIAASIFFMFAGVFMDTVNNGSAESIMAGAGVFLVGFMFLFCILLIVGTFVQFINAFAYRGIMIQNMGVMQSISHSWQLLQQNFGEVFLLAVLFFIIAMGYGILMGVLMLPLVFVSMAPLLGSAIMGDVSAFTLVYGVGISICLGIVGAVFMSVLVTWQSATFTLAYKEWSKKMGFV